MLVTCAAIAAVLGVCRSWAQSKNYAGIGRTAGAEEIKEWDISVGPSGKELPPGSGTAKEGAAIYAAKCAACHGADLAGGQGGPRLRGGEGTMTTLQIQRSVGSYWGFATTVWDFISRDMPPTPVRGTLKPNEVYALTAFILFRNGIIQETDVMDAQSLPKVKMPNRNNFVPLNPEYKKDAVRPHGIYP
jgi:cytochrome c